MKNWGLYLSIALGALLSLQACSEAIILEPNENLNGSISSSSLEGESSTLLSSEDQSSSSSEEIEPQSSESRSSVTQSSVSTHTVELPSINYSQIPISGTGAFDYTVKIRYRMTLDKSQSKMTITEYECRDGGILVPSSNSFENKYLVDTPNLFLWNEGDCNASKYQGTSTSLLGKWTMLPDEVLAPDQLGGSCSLEQMDPIMVFSLQFGTEEIESSLTEKNYCWSSLYDGIPNGCNSYTTEDGYGGTAVYRLLSVGSGSATQVKSFTHAGGTCTWESAALTPTPASCEKAWQAYEASNETYPFDYETWIRNVAEDEADRCIGATGWSSSVDY